MPLSKQVKIIIGLVIIITPIAIGATFLAFSFLNPSSINNESVKVQLLSNTGVMIESEGVRIYVDPVDLSESYSAYPADVILITHPHDDHYQSSVIEMLQKEDTVKIFPENMTSEINLHNGLGVVPGDQLQIGQITIEAFYMYIFSEYGFPTSHPREANWTSYIIDINGFTIFHAGDSKTIEEYEELTGLIDVALLPYYRTITGEEIIDAVQTIQPQYLILTHFVLDDNDIFFDYYGASINGCEVLNLQYFESHIFNY